MTSAPAMFSFPFVNDTTDTRTQNWRYYGNGMKLYLFAIDKPAGKYSQLECETDGRGSVY